MLIAAEDLARQFHETYERLAPTFNWDTQEASREPWDNLPDNQRDLMVAVIEELGPLFNSVVHDCCVVAAPHTMTVDEWLAIGRDAGFVAKGYCAMHDGLPFTDDEAHRFEHEGIDPCIPSVRVNTDAPPATVTLPFPDPPLDPDDRPDIDTLVLPPFDYPSFANMTRFEDADGVVVWTFAPEAMKAAVRAGINTYQAAAHSAPPSQTGIGFGSKACRRDNENSCIEFLDIPTFEEFGRIVGEEAALSFGAIYTCGVRFARCYSPRNPDGEWGVRHITTLNPLTGAQFATARNDGWEINDSNLRRAVFCEPRWEGDRS